MTFWGLATLWRLSQWQCLLQNCQVGSLPNDCEAYWTRLGDHFKGSRNICRGFELINWLVCSSLSLQFWTFSQYSNFSMANLCVRQDLHSIGIVIIFLISPSTTFSQNNEWFPVSSGRTPTTSRCRWTSWTGSAWSTIPSPCVAPGRTSTSPPGCAGEAALDIHLGSPGVVWLSYKTFVSIHCAFPFCFGGPDVTLVLDTLYCTVSICLIYIYIYTPRPSYLALYIYNPRCLYIL